MPQVTTKRENGRLRVAQTFEGESLTEQSMKDQANINSIMRKARYQGTIPANPSQCNYGDFSNAVDFHTAQNRLIDAQNDFMRLPASMRKRFNNDPGALIEFLSDENNIPEARDLGILNPLPEVPEASEGDAPIPEGDPAP